MADDVFEAFDHERHRGEVRERWGAEADRRSDRWWRGLSAEERAAFQEEQKEIAAGFGELAAAGQAPDSAAAEALAERHVEWLKGPMESVSRDYLIGLGEMYVSDPRFGANYPGDAEFVRDALRSYAENHL